MSLDGTALAPTLASSSWWLRGRAWVWVAPVAVGLAVRLVALGQRPLGPDEAELALRAWRMLQLELVSIERSPVLTNLLAGIFWILGASDWLTRLPVALAGTALTLLPWALRPYLGSAIATGATWLLAISPLLVFASRLVAGEMLGLLGLGLLLLGWLRWSGGGDARWLALAGSGLALGLGSTLWFVPWLIVVLGAAWLAFRAESWQALAESLSNDWRMLLAGAVAVVLVLDLAFLTAPSGLQAGVIDPLWRWPSMLSFRPEPRMLVLLASGEILVLGLAVVGFGSAQLAPRIRVFLGAWLAGGCVLGLLASRPGLEGLAFVVPPAAVLGGATLAALWTETRRHWSARVAIVALLPLLPLGHLLLAVMSATRLGEPIPTIPMVTAAAGLALIGLMSTNWLSPSELRTSLLLALGGAGLVLSAAFLGRLALNSDGASPVPGAWTLPAVERVVADVHAEWRRSPERPITIHPEAAERLGWHLRGVRLRVVEADQEAAVADADLAVLRQGQTVPGGRVVHLGGTAGWSGSAGVRDWWRWFATGESWVAQNPYAIIVRFAPR